MISANIRKSVALLAFALAACDSTTGPDALPDASKIETLRLSVRVHLLGSDELAALNSTFTESQIDTLFAGLNDIWQQATVAWQIESIIRETALNAEGYRRVMSGATSLGSVIATIFPRENLLAEGWNVFVIGDMGSFAGGIYLPSQVVIFPQSGPLGEQGTTGRGPRVLAHELGHSLSLEHVTCTAAGNLMSPGCGGGNPAGLTPNQVGAARQQASSGRPF